MKALIINQKQCKQNVINMINSSIKTIYILINKLLYHFAMNNIEFKTFYETLGYHLHFYRYKYTESNTKRPSFSVFVVKNNWWIKLRQRICLPHHLSFDISFCKWEEHNCLFQWIDRKRKHILLLQWIPRFW